jgi:hypothetical protein
VGGRDRDGIWYLVFGIQEIWELGGELAFICLLLPLFFLYLCFVLFFVLFSVRKYQICMITWKEGWMDLWMEYVVIDGDCFVFLLFYLPEGC